MVVCSICKEREAEFYLEENKKITYFCRSCARDFLLNNQKGINFLPRIKV